MPKHILLCRKHSASYELFVKELSFTLHSSTIYGDIEILYYHRVEPILVPNALFPRHALAKRTNRELIGTSVE